MKILLLILSVSLLIGASGCSSESVGSLDTNSNSTTKTNNLEGGNTKGVSTSISPTQIKSPSPTKTIVPAVTKSTYYANCTAAKLAGAAPIYSGEPGYRAALDRDNDGVACE